MPSITVKNIPEPIYKKHKQQAETQYRSMNSVFEYYDQEDR
jgi:antitoxin FitA